MDIADLKSRLQRNGSNFSHTRKRVPKKGIRYTKTGTKKRGQDSTEHVLSWEFEEKHQFFPFTNLGTRKPTRIHDMTISLVIHGKEELRRESRLNRFNTRENELKNKNGAIQNGRTKN